MVGPGLYREYVDPVNAGTPEARIVYRSIEKGAAIISGAEQVKNWKPYGENVWTARIPNGLFGTYNPYTTLVRGDWFIATYIAHTGEVYLNGKSMYEVTELDKVVHPVVYKKSWDPDFTIYTWYTEQDEATNETVLYANFQGKDPNVAKRRDQCPGKLLLSFQRRRGLHHAVRFYGKTGSDPVGTTHRLSGRYGRTALEQRLDH